MKIAIASDHAGFRYKALIIHYLVDQGYEVEDFGPPTDEPVDYPDFVHPAASAVAHGECERGIVLGGSGNGEAMAANRHRGVRCALCWDEESARLARRHNDANVLSLGERMVPENLAIRIVDVWLTTTFEAGRHARRIQKLDGALSEDDRPMRLTHVTVTMPPGGELLARDFYGGLLELREIARPASVRDRPGLWFDAGGLDLHVSVEGDRTGVDARRHFGLESADVDGLRTRLEAAGVTTEDGRPAAWRRFFVYDPFGNRIEIHERGGLRA